MRCPDAVMSAMSYHPRHRRGAIARAYWNFTAAWQRADGGLHRLAGQWYLLELASRFRFRAVRAILANSLPMAVSLQRRHGGFLADCPARSACQVVLAYWRHGMLDELLRQLRRDPMPLIESFEDPLAVRTRREALGERSVGLAARLAKGILRAQRRDGSWDGLILATAEAIHGLLDCGIKPRDKAFREACQWLLAQQRPIDPRLLAGAPPVDVGGMFYTERLDEEARWGAANHPEYRWKPPGVECLRQFAFYTTGTALAALCRCGLHGHPAVVKGFRDLLRLRGPGGRYYTDHWCNCGVGRWVRTGAAKFAARAGTRSPRRT